MNITEMLIRRRTLWLQMNSVYGINPKLNFNSDEYKKICSDYASINQQIKEHFSKNNLKEVN